MGPDGAHGKDDCEHDCGASQDHFDWTSGPYYNEQLAEGDGHNEGLHEWGSWADEWYYEGRSAEDDGHDKGGRLQVERRLLVRESRARVRRAHRDG